jgi:tRNA (guanine-N7-)-methyltransferase
MSTMNPSAICKPASYFDTLDWREMFGREAPVEIDVGCGKGNFLAWLAGTKTEHNFLGVDRQLVRLRKVEKKIQRAGLTNVRLLRLEFSYLIAKMIPTGSVTAYYVFFPDPWPKRRHAKKRLFGPEFVGELRRTLVSGGTVNVATDNAPYFEQIVGLMSGWKSEAPLALPEEARTEFEKIFLAKGDAVYRARWRKK